MVDDEVQAAAAELYGLPPAEFIAGRDAKAKAASDRETAAAIKSLRRPSRSAWLANLLARQETAKVAELLELGATMRAAQASLDGDELRRLTKERRTAVAGLVNKARTLADSPVSDSISRELEGILNAAIASEQAGQDLAAGQLSTAVAADGGAPLTWTGGGAQVIPLRPRQQPAPRQDGPTPRIHAVPNPDDDEQQTRQARWRADQELETARNAFERADSTAQQAKQAADEASAARKEAARRITELTAELERAQQDRTSAERATRAANRERDDTQRLADRARRRLDRAGAARDDLD